ncbi:MAG: 50S ribosomal protein L15 [Chloroflexi bacterium]|nr:50S ribosomal protein L15 [Chloroflexota bacterium]MBV9599924.1 50S ribosomal protein L15 [Chloroflexota bacterium]
MRIHELQSPEGATRERIRIGRGHGSGKVKTGGKGTKGQKARAGGGVPPYFEGGQLPLIRKLPYRRGFRNPFRVEFREVNVRDLASFPQGSTVGPEEFEMAGVLRGKSGPVKVLGQGELSVKLTVRAHKFSAGARQKIEAAGGTVEPIGGEPDAEAEAEADAVDEEEGV